MRRILQKDKNFHSYKIVVVQELSVCDMANCSMVAERLIRILSDNVIILMTDEAHFHLPDCVNKHNFHYWTEENPQQLYQQPLHSARVTIWCGVTNFGVTGPYFLEDKDGHAVAVTSARYFGMLWNFLTQELSRRGIELSTIWFNCTYSENIHGDCSGNISRAHYFTAR
jgi:hypothetical protein